jgi:hypothetical protein
MICIPYPQTTLAYTLIGSDTVVMAREIADKPYSFHIVEVLKGAIKDKDFNAFVSSPARQILRYNAKRQMLRFNADDAVVFRRKKGQSWQFIVYADPEYQKFIRSILEQSSHWYQFRGDRRRTGFIIEHLSHNHPDIREQTFLELGRAPYASIKRAAGTVPRRQIYEILSNRGLIEWHSLFIQMLGLSRHADDITYIRNQFEMAAAKWTQDEPFSLGNRIY